MAKTIKSPLFLMALTIFIDFTGFGIIIPLLPFWAEKLGANAFGVGLILTVYALAQFIFTPLLGSLSDRYGRRPIILYSLLIEAFSFALTALAGTLPVLLIARFIGGLGASNIGSAQAVVSDITPPEGRARGMGMIGAAIGLGFVIGPALGGILATFGGTTPFWVALGLALINALLVFRFLPETHKKETTTTSTTSSVKQQGVLLAGWRQALNHPVVARLVIINLLFTVAFTAMEAVFPLFTQSVYGWKATQNGYIFTYVGVIIVIMQGGLVGQLVKKIGEHNLMIIGLFLLALGLGLLPLSTQVGILLISLGILSAGEGAVTPIISTLISFASPADAQGETLGFAQGVGGLGRIIGPLIAGTLFDIGGPGAPFWMGTTLAVVAALLALPRMPGMQKVAATQSEPATSANVENLPSSIVREH